MSLMFTGSDFFGSSNNHFWKFTRLVYCNVALQMLAFIYLAGVEPSPLVLRLIIGLLYTSGCQ
jgi:hypothetical protein